MEKEIGCSNTRSHWQQSVVGCLGNVLTTFINRYSGAFASSSVMSTDSIRYSDAIKVTGRPIWMFVFGIARVMTDVFRAEESTVDA